MVNGELVDIEEIADIESIRAEEKTLKERKHLQIKWMTQSKTEDECKAKLIELGDGTY